MAENGQAVDSKRWLVWAGGSALALILILVIAFVIVSRPPISNGLIASLLARPGVPVKVAGAYIGLGGARIASLSSAQLNVADLKAEYGFPGVLSGKIDSVRVRSISLTAQYKDGSVIVPIAGKLGGGKSSGPLNLPAVQADAVDVALDGLPIPARLTGKLGLAPAERGSYRLDFSGDSDFGAALPTEVSATFNGKGDATFKLNAGLSGPGAPGSEPLATEKIGLLIDRLVAQGQLAAGRVVKLDADFDLRSAHFTQADIGKSTASVSVGAGTNNSFELHSGPIQLTESYAKQLAAKAEASYQAAHSQEASAALANDLDAMTALLRGRWGIDGTGSIALSNGSANADQMLRIEPRILARVFPIRSDDAGSLLQVLVGTLAGSTDVSHLDLKIGKSFSYAAHLGLAIDGVYPPHVKIGAIDVQSSADAKQPTPLTLNDVSIDWPSKKVTLGFAATQVFYAPGARNSLALTNAKLSADGALYTGVAAKALVADISGTMIDGGNKWLLAPAGGCYSAAFASLTLGPARISNGGLKACAKSGVPFATIDASGAASTHIEAALTVAPSVLNAGMKDGVKIVSFSGDAVADLGAGKPAVHLTGLQGHFADAAKSVRFAPLDFAGFVDMQNGETSGSIGATALNQVLLSAHLHQDAQGAGALDFDSGALEFANRKVEIQKLLPVLTGLVTGAQGKLRISGAMSWAAGKAPKSNGKIEFTGFGVTTKLGPIQGVDGTIALNRLWPARTSKPQTLKIKNVNVGLPLVDGAVTINLPEKFELEIVKAAWPWAGGELAMVDGHFVPGQSVQHVAMTASAIDLAAVTKLLAVDGLSATGIVDGRLPIIIDKGNASIVGGSLKARAGGVIKYTGSAGSAASAQGGAGANLLFTALKNFNFQKLDIGVDGPLAGNVTITLKLLGSNPDVYNGHAFEINIKVDSQLANLILQTTQGLRIGTQLQQGLSGRQ